MRHALKEAGKPAEIIVYPDTRTPSSPLPPQLPQSSGSRRLEATAGMVQDARRVVTRAAIETQSAREKNRGSPAAPGPCRLSASGGTMARAAT